MQNEVRVRTISGISLGLFVIVLTWFGGFGFRLLAVGIMAMVFFEWFRIVQSKSSSRITWIIGITTIVLTGVSLLGGYVFSALIITTVGAGAAGLASRLEGQNFWPAVGLIYAGYFGVAFAELRNSGEFGFAIMIFLFAIIWSTDVFAFFGGRSLGGPKLAPAISPKKTWSGFICGLAGGLLAGLLAASFFGASHYVWIACLSIILSFCGQLGDLFESAFKRRFQVKDSGDLIPGHGGVMDRMDSMIVASFAAYIIGIVMSGESFEGAGNGIAYQLLGP